MKQKIILTILITLLAVATCCICCSCTPQEPATFTLKFTAGAGGSIQGQTEQTVKQGEDATTVTAIPDEGYKFAKWSDDVTTAQRQDKAVKENITVTAIFQKKEYYTLRYVIEEGGILTDGKLEYRLKSEQTGEMVAVTAKDGYEFLGWSDGWDLLWRNGDTVWDQDITITAKFRRIDDYKLYDWYAELGVGVPTIEISKDTYEDVRFPIPEREHFTFHGWYLGDTMVADTQGRSLFTYELLSSGERDIYAKWTAKETFSYKILLVYPTRIEATLPHVDSRNSTVIHVDYTISELEREFCHLTTLRAKQYLDKMLDGLVDFQVDEYFLTDTITTEDFATSVSERRVSSLSPEKIAEVKDLVHQYDSALILYNCPKETTVHAGVAGARYGEIRLDSFFSVMDDNSTLEQVVELMKKSDDILLWKDCYLIDNYLTGTIAHELAHTIELRMDFADYHHYANGLDINDSLTGFDSDRLYYLNEIISDGKKVGIPYKFWKGDMGNITYNVTQGIYGEAGYVVGSRSSDIHSEKEGTTFEVIFGDSITVTARSFRENEYRFVKWSDGVTTATRTDVVTGDKEFLAIFEPIDYEFTVEAKAGGVVEVNNKEIIKDSANYSLNVEEGTMLVKAIANEGYRFASWSDGDTDWQKSIRADDLMKIVDENNKVTLYAIFERIE